MKPISIARRTAGIFAFSSLSLVLLQSSLALAEEEVNEEPPPPYSRIVGLSIPLTFGVSLMDLVHTPTTEYLNSSGSFDTGLDIVFPSVFEWSVIDFGVTGSTGAVETPSNFREYGVYSATTVPSINIPWGLYGSSALRFYSGIGFAKVFSGKFGGTTLPNQNNGVLNLGVEFAGNFNDVVHNWHYEALGVTYTRYLQNSPVINSTSIVIHAKVTYDLVLLK
jgi:hypothetical protein